MIKTANTEIEIIQGDTFYRPVRLVNIDLDAIESLYFSCNKLGITKQLTRKDDVFELEIDCGTTATFDNTVCCYDLTIKFIGNKMKTIEYKGKLTVLKKVNKVTL